MTITVVGNLDSATGTALTSLTLTAAAAVGDVRVLVTKLTTSTIGVATVSGGNCDISSGASATRWKSVAGPTNDTAGTVGRHEIWIGVVSNANTSQHETITLTWASSTAGLATDLDCRTFSNGNTATTWARDGTQSGFKDNATSTTITYPTLTAAGSGELAVFKARAPSGGAYGTPSGGGFTWVTTTDANGNPYIYSVSAGSGTVAPTQTTNSTDSHAIGVLLIASAATTHALAATGLAATTGSFDMCLPPVVTAISPATGTGSGGTAVTISGRNLWNATAVKFAAASATSVVAGTIATITAVGTLVSAVAAQQTTLSVSPAAAGNVLCLAVETKFTVGQNYSCTGVSGGGVPAAGNFGAWTRAMQLLPDAQGIHEISIWFGIVTTPGAATITATFSNAGTVSTELACQEFSPSTGANTAWVIDVVGSLSSGASTSPPYPSLTPTSTGELYFGFIQWPGTGSGGGTSGFTYQTDANGNQVAYNLNASGTVSPVASSASQVSSAGAVLLRAIDSRVTCVSPSGTGTVDVTVVTPCGTSATVAADQFTYTALVLAAAGLASTSGSFALAVLRPLAATGLASTSGSFLMGIPQPIAATGLASTSGSFMLGIPQALAAAGLAATTGSMSLLVKLPMAATGLAATTGSFLMFVGHGVDPFALTTVVPRPNILDCGVWRVFIATRGGGNLLAELDYETLTLGRKLDDVSVCSVTVLAAKNEDCLPILGDIEPFQHEVVAFRNYRPGDAPAWAGPVTLPSWDPLNLVIGARDLFTWLERRTLPVNRSFTTTDLASIFGQYLVDGLNQDASPNISPLFLGEMGTAGARAVTAISNTIAGDALRELSRSGVDFTCVGRTLRFGGRPINIPSTILYDPAVYQDPNGATPKLTKQGLNMATRVVVKGGLDGAGNQVVAPVGFPDGPHGLISQVVSEPLILDTLSGTHAAADRLAFLNPAPQYLSCQLTPQAPIRFDELIPGIRIDAAFSVGLTTALGPFRLQAVDVTSSQAGEVVSLTLVPLVV